MSTNGLSHLGGQSTGHSGASASNVGLPKVQWKDLEQYCNDQADSLIKICSLGDLLPAVCLATFTEYLANLTYNKSSGVTFKQFVTNKLPPKYKEFCYTGGMKDLPEQLYQVFRCGLVHNMSFVVANGSKFMDCPQCGKDIPLTAKGRTNSVIVTHEGRGYKHLDHDKQTNSAVLVLETYAADLKRAVTEIFLDSTHRNNATLWDQKHPRITAMPSPQSSFQ